MPDTSVSRQKIRDYFESKGISLVTVATYFNIPKQDLNDYLSGNLTPENEASLRDFVHGIIVDEIEKARRDTAVDKRVLNQTEIAKYFNVSTTTIREWEKLGLPHGSVSKQGKFYDKEECRRWLLSQKR
ncbi:MAG: hypothetical protein E7G83_20790 [Klebsiella aerogenes]|nr:hypothetical protein [Klebsiella aerogenes]